MGVSVGEKTTLQHFIGRWLDAWYNMGGRERGLFHILVVVVRVTVKNLLSYWDQGIITVGPDFCDIEDVPFVFGSVRLGHNLSAESPGGEVPSSDLVEQIVLCEIHILNFHRIGIFSREILDSLVSFEMPFDEESLAIFVNPSVGVRAISVHTSVPVRGSSV